MRESKLTIDQFKNYLRTGLNIETNYRFRNCRNMKRVSSIDTDSVLYLLVRNGYETAHPICYRLSDLDKFIPELGFIPLDQVCKLDLGHKDWISKERDYLIKNRGFDYWFNQIPFGILQKLFQWHFWPFGDEYFEEGLVINKLNFN